MLERALFGLDTPLRRLPVGGYRPEPEGRQMPAAVLLGLVRASIPEVLLARRSDALSRHPGQVALPGGGAETGDGSVVATALRETREETGIPESAITPVGLLGRYDTITGYRITVVVGWIAAGVVWQPDRREIDELFTVPVTHLTDPDNFQRQIAHFRDRRFELLTLKHPRHHIWGATAAILHDFASRIGASGPVR
ncbi:MAG: hypothetical protein Kow0020_12220 [Wenzhouxiangellaceae bacterium]